MSDFSSENERKDGEDLHYWLKRLNIFDVVLYEKLDSEGYEFMPNDLKYTSAKKWQRIKKDLYNNNTALQRAMENRLKIIEKYWRQQSGIKTTSIQKNNDGTIKTINDVKPRKSKNRYKRVIGGKSVLKDDAKMNRGNNNKSKKHKPKKKVYYILETETVFLMLN